jgi:hypothetical protein
MPALNDMFKSHGNLYPDTKKDKNPLKCSLFRPISLLGVDVKRITKILAHGLEVMHPDLVKPDQTGFVKSRFGTDNVRGALNIINHLCRVKEALHSLSLLMPKRPLT